MSLLYILDENKKPVPCDDIAQIATFLGDRQNAAVAKDVVGEVEISTIFVPVPNVFGHPDRPLFFETMVFGGMLDFEREMCATWDEAEFQHAQMVERVRNA